MAHRSIAVAAFLLLAVIVTGQRAVAQSKPSDGRRKPRIVSSFHAEPGAKYPFRENMYRALQLPDGRIIALSIARGRDRQQTMQGRFSRDNGQTWSPPQDLFHFPKEAGGFGLFDALVDRDGEIQIAVLCDGNSGILFPKPEGAGNPTYDILEIWHTRSKDKTNTWGPPKRIREGMAGDLLSITQLRNGRIVLPFCFNSKRTIYKRGEGFLEYTYAGTDSCSSMCSDDNGITWQLSPDVLSVQTPDLSTYGADEPVVIQLKDGRVWMLMRTQRGRFYESFSDDGLRWSPPQPTKLISSDSPAALMRLKDGSILLFSNACLRYPYAYGGRFALHGAISRDEGSTWLGLREIARDPARDDPPDMHGDYGLAYTFPTLTADDQVLFSNWVEEGPIRRFRLFDPAWLLQTHQECDFSEGLDDWSVFGSRGVEVQSKSPDEPTKVLSVRKADAQWPAGAVWNFPMGATGSLRLRLKVRPDFGGALLGLSDHFSPPWDEEDQFNNVFNLPITAAGLIAGSKLQPDRWYELELAWDVARRRCQIQLDKTAIGQVENQRMADGVNYLRLRSTSLRVDDGCAISNVKVDVSLASGVRPSTNAIEP